MGKNKAYNSMMVLIFSVIAALILNAALIFFGFKPLMYIIGGDRYDATVTVVGTEDDKNYAEAMYQLRDGTYQYRQVLTYGSIKSGDEFKAYVLQDEKKIFRMPPAWIVALFCGGYVILMFVLTLLIVKHRRIRHDNIMLSKNGKAVTGQVVTVTRKRAFVFDCNVTFTDDEGRSQIAFVRFNKIVPSEGGECRLMYCFDKNGRLICDTIEL